MGAMFRFWKNITTDFVTPKVTCNRKKGTLTLKIYVHICKHPLIH